MYTNACGTAAGAFFRGDWLYHHFQSDSPVLADLHINYKEFLAQVSAAFRWGHSWAKQHIIIHCDNLAAVYIINKGSTAHPLIMHALRLLFWLSAIYNFRFIAVYVQGHLNTTADAVSCLHEPSKCVAFYHHLQQVQPREPPNSTPLTQHMSLHSCNFLFFRGPRTPNWHSNFKKKCISTSFTPLLGALKHRIAPTGLVICGFVSIWVTLPSQPNLPIFVSIPPF